MNLKKKLERLEQQKQAWEAEQLRLLFEGRSMDELRFFFIHGYFPEGADCTEPSTDEFVVCGFRTTIILEPTK